MPSDTPTAPADTNRWPGRAGGVGSLPTCLGRHPVGAASTPGGAAMTPPDPYNADFTAVESTNGHRDGPGPVQGGVSGKPPLAGGGFERQQAAKGSGATTKNLSIFKAVRAKCIDCAGGSRKYVKHCPGDGLHALRCALWAFRFGLRPETARKRYGADFLDPKAMPDADANLDDLR